MGVKADPDVVFIASRLQQKLASIKTPKEGIYIEHCKEVQFGMFGSLEVISKTAAVILFQNVETCYNDEVKWKTCKHADTPAFKPLKESSQYFACLSAIT